MSFKRGKDPIKAMGLGWGKKQNTNTYKILRFIESFGDEGVGLTDIQKFIYVNLNGHSEEEFYETTGEKHKEWYGGKYISPHDNNSKNRATRGYYTTLLYGAGPWGFSGLKGILPTYCERIGKKWRLKRFPEPGENLTVESFNNKKLVPSLNEYLSEGYIDI